MRIFRCINGEGVTKLDAMKEAAIAVEKEGFPRCCS
jgi:hypothetical protein